MRSLPPCLAKTCVLLVVLALGCQTRLPLPKTYPVTGVVLSRDGKPYARGAILFRSVTQPEIIATATLDEKGEFRLVLTYENQKADGAPEGEYTALVMPPDESSRGTVPINLPGTFKIDASARNHFEIKLGAR